MSLGGIIFISLLWLAIVAWVVFCVYAIKDARSWYLEEKEIADRMEAASHRVKVAKTSGFKRFWLYLLCKLKLKSILNGEPRQSKQS
jgi:hypothetical protein